MSIRPRHELAFVFLPYGLVVTTRRYWTKRGAHKFATLYNELANEQKLPLAAYYKGRQ